MIEVVIADDQAMVRDGFGALLASQPDMRVTGSAGDGRHAVELCRRRRPDVVLMDVRMPVLDGLAATRELLAPAEPHRPKVLMLTTFDIDEYVFEALQAGASGFLLKDATAEDLVTAVRVVAGGQALLAPTVTRRLIERFVAQSPVARVEDTRLRSSPRGRKRYSDSSPAATNAEVAAALDLAEETVKTHVGRILSKLGLRDRVQAVVFATRTAWSARVGRTGQPTGDRNQVATASAEPPPPAARALTRRSARLARLGDHATMGAGRCRMAVRSTLRWAATHGVLRMATRRRARAGNPDAQLLVNPALQADPYAQYEKLRGPAPFAEGAVSRLTVHHDVCTEVLRSDDFGAIARAAPLPAPVRLMLRLAGPSPYVGPVEPPSMLAVDPPAHTRYRRLVTRAFTARAVARLRERTEVVAAELLDDLERAGRDSAGPVDLVGGYASLLPVTVISELLGVPVAMREQFLAWGDGAAASLDMGLDRARYERVQENIAEIEDWMREHLRRLRARPGDDLLSTLVTVTDDDGSGLTETELVATASLLLGAGFETTVNLIGNGVALLFAHPEQRRLLAEQPSRWPNAVDEILRVESPVQRTARRARRDTTVHGVRIAENELVVTLLAAANRDPKVFAEPHTFDVTRDNAKDHLGFSSGIHYCLGAALARMEGEVALRALFERFPDLAPAGAPHRRGTRVLRGCDAMPVALGAPTGARHS